MATTSETHAALKLLAAEFERSKQEQIERFLRDQEELNTKFSEFTSRSGDGEKEAERQSSDDSDTASVFSQHMALYKSRPQTAAGWVSEMENGDGRHPADGNKDADVDQEAAEWRNAVAMATRLSGEDSQYSRNDSQQKYHRGITGSGRSGETGRLLNRRSKFPPKNTFQSQQAIDPVTNETPGSDPRLLARRTTRPRTATGLRSRTKTSEPHHLVGDPTEGSPARNRPLRASAPATLSRSNHGHGDAKSSSYLPDTQRQNGFINRQVPPSYAVSSKQMPLTTCTNDANKIRSSFKVKQDSLDSSNCMIISSMTAHAKDQYGAENGRMTGQLHLRKEFGNRMFCSLDRDETVKKKSLAQIRLPSVSRDDQRGQKISQQSLTQTDKTTRKKTSNR